MGTTAPASAGHGHHFSRPLPDLRFLLPCRLLFHPLLHILLIFSIDTLLNGFGCLGSSLLVPTVFYPTSFSTRDVYTSVLSVQTVFKCSYNSERGVYLSWWLTFSKSVKFSLSAVILQVFDNQPPLFDYPR